MVVVYMAFSTGVGFVTSWYALILHYIIPEGDILCLDVKSVYCGASTLIWNDTLGNPNDVISPMTLPSSPKFDNAPRINPHGNHKNLPLIKN